MRTLVLSVVFVGFVVGLVGAQEVPPGYDAASFARIGVGVGPLGMAGAVVAAPAGPTALYWNPAGLADLKEFVAEGMYTNWLGAGIHYQYLLAAGYPPLGDPRPALRLGPTDLIFGLGWIFVVIPDIPYVDEEGRTGVFSASSHLVLGGVGLSLPRWPGLTLGATAKLYHDRILEGQSLGVGVDLGLRWRGTLLGFPVALGLATTDVGDTPVRWYGTLGEPVNYVPWLVRVGLAAWAWEERVVLSASFEWGLRRPRFERLRLGLQVSLAWASLRAGYDWLLAEPQGQWRVGLGVRPLEWMSVDYAFVPAALGESHLLAFQVRF